MSAPSVEEKARKVKSLLSSYYTVERNDASQESPATAGPGNASRWAARELYLAGPGACISRRRLCRPGQAGSAR